MKKYILTSLVLIFAVCTAFAQFEDQVNWKRDIQKTDRGTVEVVFTATIAPGLHIYAAEQPDGSFALPTALELDETSTGVTLAGGLLDKGEKITAYDDIMQVDQSYFDGTAAFVQKVTIEGNAPVLYGVLSYQVCDDAKCVPYFDKIEIKL